MELAEGLLIEEEEYRAVTTYLGDVDYLRNSQQQLVGFSFILGEPSEQEDAVQKRLLAQSKSVSRGDGMLVILLNSERYEIQCVQAIGATVYRSSNDKLALAIPNWGFGDLGFELTPVS